MSENPFESIPRNSKGDSMNNDISVVHESHPCNNCQYGRRARNIPHWNYVFASNIAAFAWKCFSAIFLVKRARLNSRTNRNMTDYECAIRDLILQSNRLNRFDLSDATRNKLLSAVRGHVVSMQRIVLDEFRM